ncbi:MAG: hypothetical protein LT070_04155 [Solirubrobacteraceae bacterium]|nr:hypothetical protein [Solirubrobacteraceae bacterium]
MRGRPQALVALSLVAAQLTGCGAERPRGTDGRPTSAGERPARLTVRQTLTTEVRYVEGSMSRLRVEEIRSGAVISDELRPFRGDEPLFDRRLEPGEYRLTSHQRPCSGNCANLDPPTDGCETTVRLEPGRNLAATIALAPSQGCTIGVG